MFMARSNSNCAFMGGEDTLIVALMTGNEGAPIRLRATPIAMLAV
jgi:hypothetical protein